MSSPVIWIILPGLTSLIFFIIRGWNRMMTIVGFVLAILLSWLAWIVPIGEPLVFRGIRFTLEDTLTILGRQFVLKSQDASALVLIYVGVAFWFGASRIANTRANFIPGGMLIASLLTAAIAVEPFLYAALLIEMGVLVFVALMIKPGQEIGRGTLRYLTLQTLGLPFILFAGWLLTGVEASPDDLDRVQQASLFLGFGFVILLGIFPFHTWIPMIAEESHPYVVAFVFYLHPTVVILFGLGFLDQYAWLRNQEGVRLILRYLGILMVLIAGFWVLFQRHLGRIIGFAVIFGNGITLLLTSVILNQTVNSGLLEILFIQLLPLGLSLGLWALSCVALSGSTSSWSEALQFRKLAGVARNNPIASTTLVLSILSLAGFPLLAGYPARLTLWHGLANESITLGLVAIFGCVCIVFIGLRTMAVLVMGTDREWRFSEPWGIRIFLLLGLFILILNGIMPQIFTPFMTQMTEMFGNLSP